MTMLEVMLRGDVPRLLYLIVMMKSDDYSIVCHKPALKSPVNPALSAGIYWVLDPLLQKPPLIDCIIFRFLTRLFWSRDRGLEVRVIEV